MPTGLTYKIEESDSYTFRQFALHCATRFGACVHQRDENTFEPRHRTVGEYAISALKNAKTKLAQLRAMSADDIEQAIQADSLMVLQENEQSRKEFAVKSARYDKVRKQVEAWIPPTPEHDGLKKFMLKQIEISQNDEPYVRQLPEQNPKRWIEVHLKSAEESIVYFTEQLEKEEKRVKESNEWIDALVESLDEHEPKRKKRTGT